MAREPISDDALASLADLLAGGAHEEWVRQLTAAGWRHGERTDDERREHPKLVPYESLAEAEKASRRSMALVGLKALLEHGYRIEGPEAGPWVGHEAIELPDLSYKDEPSWDLAALLALWRTHAKALLVRGPHDAQRIAGRLVKIGEPLVAYDILAEALRSWPQDVRLQQLLALALARSGVTVTAHEILKKLHGAGHADEETLGLLARLHKDQALETTDERARAEHLTLAHETYRKAFGRTGGYWTGVNAATMALLRGLKEEAATIAGEVERSCREQFSSEREPGEDRYWVLATLGETALLQEKLGEAQDWYARAAEAGARRVGDLSSTRRNARLICRELGADVNTIDRWFRIPSVAVCAGHMVDRPGRALPRFPGEIEPAVRAEIRRRLEKADARVGYASAACGSDILFLESVLDLGGEVRVVLPYEKERFIRDSVDIVPGSSWLTRFERVLVQAAEVTIASDQGSAADHVSFDYVNRLIFGLARDRATRLETNLVPVVVWDGRGGEGPGGTAAAVGLWRLREHGGEIIDLKAILHSERPDLSVPQADTAGPSSAVRVSAGLMEDLRTVAILFADAVGFSKLTEDQIPEFVNGFLGPIGELAIASSYAPLFSNTWGDGLVFVFSSVGEAGRFALDLADRVRVLGASRPPERPLPALRIGLHAGPVFACKDPVTARDTFFGTHMTRAARIEPITPPGHVYASHAFAAIAAFEDVRDFGCEYVGRIPLAKGYGAFPLYHVRRRP